MKDTQGVDKGPFWTGHKKFPTAAAYDGADAAHWGFMVATTHLFGAMLGVHPAKEEDDDDCVTIIISLARTRARHRSRTHPTSAVASVGRNRRSGE